MEEKWWGGLQRRIFSHMIEFIIAKAIKHDDVEGCGFKAVTSHVRTWDCNQKGQEQKMRGVLQLWLQ